MNTAQRWLILCFVLMLVPVVLMIVGDYGYQSTQYVERVVTDGSTLKYVRAGVGDVPLHVILGEVIISWGFVLGVLLWMVQPVKQGRVRE